MTLASLLEKARQLAKETWLISEDVEQLALEAERAEAALKLQRHTATEYETEVAGAVARLDGTRARVEFWQCVVGLLDEAERSELKALTALQELRHDIRRAVAIAEHEKAKATREEVRA